MGNLLNAPILEKDTHVGRTVDQYSYYLQQRSRRDGDDGADAATTVRSSGGGGGIQSSFFDGGGLHYGISSMQGWRIHMEDAHIAQPFLFAEEEEEEEDDGAITSDNNDDEEEEVSNGGNSSNDINHDKTSKKNRYILHPLPNHSLFAIFDGHGGKFAANFSSRNLLRILSRNSNFVQYAIEWNGRGDYLKKKKRECGCKSKGDGGGGGGGGSSSGGGEKKKKEEEEGVTMRGKMPSSMTSESKMKTDTESSTTSSIEKSTTSSCSESGGDEEGDDDIKDDDVKGDTSASNAKATTATIAMTTTNIMDNIKGNDNDDDDDDNIDDRHQRLRQLKKRGHECDERVRAIKDQVRRCFDDDKEDDEGEDKANGRNDEEVDDIAVGNNQNASDHNDDEDSDEEYTDAYYRAEATHDRHLMFLLESALRDAFLDLDAELLAEMRGDESTAGRDKDANTPYGARYDLNKLLGYASIVGGGEYGGVGHLPKEFGNDNAAAMEDDDNKKPVIEVDAGTTAVVVLITPKWIVCANAGDSRAVYSRSSHRSVPLSYDHKPTDEAEERRIRSAGGYVAGGRVEADLAVSRGLGDYRFKEFDVAASGSWGENRGDSRKGGATSRGGVADAPMMRPSEQKVSPVPDIIVQNRDPKEDEFIVLACDGIWDVQTNQECVKMVADIFADGESNMGLVCEEILDQCLMKGSKDNMTAAVIKFPKQASGKGGGVLARREKRSRTQSSNKF